MPRLSLNMIYTYLTGIVPHVNNSKDLQALVIRTHEYNYVMSFMQTMHLFFDATKYKELYTYVSIVSKACMCKVLQAVVEYFIASNKDSSLYKIL